MWIGLQDFGLAPVPPVRKTGAPLLLKTLLDWKAGLLLVCLHCRVVADVCKSAASKKTVSSSKYHHP